MDYWNHVLWSDEIKINLFGSDGVNRVWVATRVRSTKTSASCLQSNMVVGSVMVWGCMSAAGHWGATVH